VEYFKETPYQHCYFVLAHRAVEPVNTGYEEYTTKTKVSHLLYMNDLKLIGETEAELQK